MGFSIHRPIQVHATDRMRSIAILLILIVGATPGASNAQEASGLIDRAKASMAEGRFESAVRILDRAASQNADNPEIHFLRATALADSSIGDMDRAQMAIDRAIDLDPDNSLLLEMKLELMPSATTGFLPFLREQRRIDLANRILDLDSTSAVANEEIAIRAYKEFREYHKASTFPFGSGSNNRADVFDIRGIQAQGPGVSLYDRATEGYDKAVTYFRRSISSDATRKSTYRWLASLFSLREDYEAIREMLVTMRSNLPENPEMLLYMGFVEYRDASQEDAGQYFDRALSMMSEEEAMKFESVVPILRSDADLPRSDAITNNYWESRDPRLLTEINERKVEHYTRMVHADLAFGQMPSGTRGWDTEQGRIYVRYGEPIEDTVIRMDRGKGFFAGDDAESFNIWDYGDFKFVFDKAVEMDEYRAYSPSAVAMSGPGTRAVSHDYVIITRNTIRETPDRYDHNPNVARVEFPYLVSRFRGKDGLTDIFVAFGVQVPFRPRRGPLRMPLTTGAFLLVDSVGIVSQHRDSIRLLEPVQILEFKETTTWIDVHRLKAPPGAYEVSVEFETETGAIVGFHRSEVEAVLWETPGLASSDILLAYTVLEAEPGEPVPKGFIERNDLLIQPAPWGVFRTDQPLYFYLEAYGLTIGADDLSKYAIEAALVEYTDESGLASLIKSIFGRRSQDGVSVRFEGSGSSPDHGQYLILDATDQVPGTYVLVVRFTDTVSSDTVEKRRVLILE